MKDFNLRDQVNDVRAAAFARQAEDIAYEIEEEIIDTVCKYRGSGANFSMSLKGVAENVGFGEVSNPAKKGQNLVSSAIHDFMISAFILAIVESCEKMGIDRDDAMNIAIVSYERELSNGKSTIEIFREVFCG